MSKINWRPNLFAPSSCKNVSGLKCNVNCKCLVKSTTLKLINRIEQLQQKRMGNFSDRHQCFICCNRLDVVVKCFHSALKSKFSLQPTKSSTKTQLASLGFLPQTPSGTRSWIIWYQCLEPQPITWIHTPHKLEQDALLWGSDWSKVIQLRRERELSG